MFTNANNEIIPTLHLFPKLNKHLFELLDSLNAEDWQKQTVIPNRTVKDLASHLLDGSLRRLSMNRDGYTDKTPQINSYHELVDHIQTLNSTWIDATKRLSPQIMIAMLKNSENWLYEYFKTLDLNQKAKFSVAWAGEEESANWFDIAREYTEKWHHQMQIRLAVKRELLYSPELYNPVLETFMRGLPHTYRDVSAQNGLTIQFKITGEGGGTWNLRKTNNHWQLYPEPIEQPDVSIVISGNIAWRIFTDSIDHDEAIQYIECKGDIKYKEPILNMMTVLRHSKNSTTTPSNTHYCRE